MNQLSPQASVNLSLCHGADLPSSVVTNSLPQILQQAATNSRGILLIRETNQQDFLAYSDLLAGAEGVSAGLRQQGLQPQDRVILYLEDPRHFFLALWGCFLGGFVPIPLGVDLSGDRRKLLQAYELGNVALVITDQNLGDLVTVQVEDLLSCDRHSDGHQGNLDDLALLLLTSGSTGKPKGVRLSARNLIASIYGMATVNDLSGQDISLNWMPLEHVASLVMFHLTEVFLGCQQIQVKSELILPNPLYWLDLIHQHRVTATWSPNFAYNLVNEQLDPLGNSISHDWDLSCVRWMGNGAEAVVGKTAGRFLELLAPYGLSPTVVSPGYGMSETTSGIAHSHDFYLNLAREYVSVGMPIPGVSLRIVDENFQVIPQGEVGLLQVKGATVMAGYDQQPELNQEVFTDGWFSTGDLGFLQSGQLTITGRQKDVIIVNGVNYYNHEIEAVVEDIGGVTVSYTAACGVMDDQQQEQVAIFFHTEFQGEQLRELVNCMRRDVFTQVGIAPIYLLPVAQETIPKTAIGKIMRSQLAQRFAGGEFASVVAEMDLLVRQRNLAQQDLPVNGIEQRLVAVWQGVLGLDQVGVRDNFFELGGNSLLLMQVLSKLTPEYDLLAVALFQYPTIAALAGFLTTDPESLAQHQGKRRGELRRQRVGKPDVAIIGMSCRFPGANCISQFWHNLCQGVESISFFEDEEILATGVARDLLSNPSYVKASPILDDVEGFDADFWGYSPKEAQLLDPQQRLFMECAWESLEDAGYDPLVYQGDISLYGGAATNTYLLNNIYPHRQEIDLRDDLGVMNLSSMGGFQVTTANDKDYLTTRTSYKLNFTGASVNVQTACSTSLVTVHLACQSLLNGECDMALAGGVSVHSPQKMGYLYQEGMILSADGHCRAFDADATGTIFGSGAGMVVLKLLDRAVADGDRIYGVIKGSAVNNDGASKVGYFAPNVDGQTRVVAEAIAYADIAPESVSYVEAHGTGTKLGDPIEITALSQAYHHDTRKTGYCAVGSVKSNVGHLQMASGIVGLIKTTLCLYHRQIPASLHVSRPNPQIDFEGSPFYLNRQLQDWEVESFPRRAGVNSLGIGGTNAHVVMEEFVKPQETSKELPGYLLTLSAKNETALQQQVANYREYLTQGGNGASLGDICLTSNVGRHHFDYRWGITGSNQQELIAKLADPLIVNRVKTDYKLAFLFTGQGSQYVGMAQQLYSICDLFRENCDRCWQILQSLADDSVWQTECFASLGEFDLDLNRTEYAQPLLFMIEYSLAQLWLTWGIKPDVLMGHSIGEYVAATIAEVFSLADALKLVFARGKLMQSLPENGGMLAVFTTENRLENLVDHRVSIAGDNGTHLVLSGLKSDLQEVAKTLESLSIKTKLLNVSHGFHSPLMQPMIEEFRQVANEINYTLPTIPLVSNLTGELATKAIATSDYWIEHILQPVQFAKSIKYLDRQQVNIWLEIGTKPTLITMAQGMVNEHLFLSSLNPQQPDWQNILESLAQLYIAGVEINWQAVTRNYHGHKTSLPTYPFQRQRYWFDLPSKDNSPQPLKQNPLHPLLGTLLSSPLKQKIFQGYLSHSTFNWLKDHVLNQQIIYPGTAYIEMAIALGLFHYQTSQITIQNLIINAPLFIEKNNKNETPQLQSILIPEAPTTTWEIHSLSKKSLDNQWQLNCSGIIAPLNITLEGTSLINIKKSFTSGELNVLQHYQDCQQKGINYGNSFQGIKQLWAKNNEALGLIELPDHLEHQEYHLHPALLDSCLQILLAALPPELATTTYIPVGLTELSIQGFNQRKVWSYLKLQQPPHPAKTLLADVWIYDDQGNIILTIKGLKSQPVKNQPAWHNWLYQPQWQPQLPLSPPVLTKTKDTWLIFADSQGIAQQLTTKLTKQQQPYHLVNHHDIANNPQAFITLIQQHPHITGVIYLWSLDQDKHWTECQSYLYLVQAVIQHQENPTLWLITHNAQVVNHEHLTPGINHSCLWGMQKAIALEHPELRCNSIDLDDLHGAATHILESICQTDNEQVAYRHNRRYVSRLIKYNWEKQQPTDKNLQLSLNHPGNLDSLEWKSVNRQQPQNNQIEIEVKATGLNFRDVMVALDLYPDETKFLGLECAGIVTAVGKEVTNFKIGDPVMAIADNSFSQYLVVNSLLAIPKPPSLSYPAAATIPVTFLTAYYTLVYLAQLQPGEKVLIHAAAGGVGLAAIQIAQQIGAEIYATASPSKWSLLKSWGVKQIMNSRSLDFAPEIMSATNGAGVDVVLNSLAGEFISQSISVLNPQGRFLEIGKQNIWTTEAVAQVQPNIQYSIVDLWQITQDNPELIQQMLSELHRQLDPHTTTLTPLPHTNFTHKQTIDAFRYMQQGKHQGKIIITPSPRPNPNFQGAYLITGGMGAIGLQVAQWLTTKGVTNLVLLGRRDIKPELKPRLKKIQENTQVNLIKADIANTDQLAQVLRQIELELPPLKGVIHCAGVTSDRTITQQDWQSFQSVLAPKVQGAANLHHLTQKYDLNHFILFSSASSLLGSPGQVNYCAANAFLDTLAQARKNLGLPAIAINWSAWENTGLAANNQITDSLKQQGIGSIEPIQGIEILDQLILNPPAQIGVIPINWDLWQQHNSVTPYYKDLVTTKIPAKNSNTDQQQLMSVIPEQRKPILINQISQHVGRILGIKDSSKIDLELGFSELGLDSLASVELRNKLQASYNFKLPVTVIFDYSNIKKLAYYLLEIMFDDLNQENNNLKQDNNLNQIENLSEIEAEVFLLEELKNIENL